MPVMELNLHTFCVMVALISSIFTSAPSPPAYYTATSGGRAPPLCPVQSYQLTEVNTGTTLLACAILAADFTLRSLIIDAPIGDLLLYGTYDTRVGHPILFVGSAWRAPALAAAPAAAPAASDPTTGGTPTLAYYSLSTSNLTTSFEPTAATSGVAALPSAPASCDLFAKLFATLLNFPMEPTVTFATLDVQSPAPFTQLDWLSFLLTSGRALALGYPSSPPVVPGGTRVITPSVCTADSNFTVVRVFIQLPVPHFACLDPNQGPVAATFACPPQPASSGASIQTYTRDAHRCLVMTGCVKRGACPDYVIACTANYTLYTVQQGPGGCPQFFCDPTFTLPVP